MKKFFYIISTFLQFIFIIGTFMVQHFSMKKMGMMRYVIYKNQALQSQYPIPKLQHTAIAILILLSVICLFLYFKNREKIIGKMAGTMLAFQVVLTFIFVFFTLRYSTSSYRAYYFISLLLALTSLIQSLKVIIYFNLKKSESI